MRPQLRLHRAGLGVAAVAAVVLAVAGYAVASGPPDSMPDTASTSPTVVDGEDLAAWQTLEISDVDGATLSVADYAGTPLLVETFATWCGNCRAQLHDTNEAARQLGGDAAVLALSVEVDLSADDVAEYAEANGYDAIRFAVMTPELLAAFVDEFGTTVANPPATPKIVVDATGVAGEMTTGFESVDDLVKVLTDAGPPLATATSSPEPAQASSSPTTEP